MSLGNGEKNNALACCDGGPCMARKGCVNPLVAFGVGITKPYTEEDRKKDTFKPSRPMWGILDAAAEVDRIETEKMLSFDSGATRNRKENELAYEGFLSPLALTQYGEWEDEMRSRAWAAGLFEGEGCITLMKSGGRKRKDGTRANKHEYPRLCMSMTDEDTIRKFHSIVAGGTVRGPYSKEKNRKPIWYWQASGQDAKRIAVWLYPYLGRRRAQRLFEVFGEFQTGVIAGLSPLALKMFGTYMHHHRVTADGTVREPDNWQKGMPLDSYMDSLLRHVMDLWLIHRGFESEARESLKEALAGAFFNLQGYMHTIAKEELNR